MSNVQLAVTNMVDINPTGSTVTLNCSGINTLINTDCQTELKKHRRLHIVNKKQFKYTYVKKQNREICHANISKESSSSLQ